MKLFKVHKSPAFSMSTVLCPHHLCPFYNISSQRSGHSLQNTLEVYIPVLVGVRMSLCTTPEGTVNHSSLCIYMCLLGKTLLT